MGPQVPDPVAAEWLRRAAELTQQQAVGAWPDRRAARVVSDQLFAEYGAAPDGRITTTEYELVSRGRTLWMRGYRCADPPTDGAPPVVVRVHGGGYAFGSIDEHQNDALARDRALATGASVFAVDHRLAPEAPFPAAVDDIVDAVTYLRATADALQVDGSRVVLNGISSGAGLAAAAALLLADQEQTPLVGMVLEAPSTDLRPTAPWLSEYAADSGLADRAALRAYYLRGADPDDPRASPSAGDLSRLPPTHIVTAELDPLREVGEQLARQLRAAGVSVTATRHLAAVHGTASLTWCSRMGRLWNAEVNEAVRALLAEHLPT